MSAACHCHQATGSVPLCSITSLYIISVTLSAGIITLFFDNRKGVDCTICTNRQRQLVALGRIHSV